MSPTLPVSPGVVGGTVGGSSGGGDVSGGSLVVEGGAEGEIVGGGGAGGPLVGPTEVWVGAGFVAVGPMVDGMIGGPSPLAGAAVE